MYVGYAHVFGATDTQNANEAQAEYHLSADWMAQTVFGERRCGRLRRALDRRY